MSRPRQLGLSLLQRLGDAVGSVAWLVPLRAKAVTQVNLRHCFPALDDAQRQQLGRASARAAGRFALEALAVWCGYRRVEQWIVAVEGIEAVERALTEGRGVVCLVPHFGNWELLNLYLGRRFTFSALYAPRRAAWLDRWLLRGRSWAGARMQPIGAAGLRVLRAALRRNEVVGVLPDQVPDGSGVVDATFFGRRARTSTLGVRLAETAGAALFAVSARRLETGMGFAIHFDALSMAPTTSAGQRVDVMQRAIEAIVQRDPAQYQWSYKRFKHAEAGVDLYKLRTP